MKSREWMKTYNDWRDYRAKDPGGFQATEERCRLLTNGSKTVRPWPECFTWAMWCLKHGTDPRLVDAAVNYVINNQSNERMTFYSCKNKHAYMTKIVCDEMNKALVAEGRWEEVKQQDKRDVGRIGEIVDRTMQAAKIAALESRIKELEKSSTNSPNE